MRDIDVVDHWMNAFLQTLIINFKRFNARFCHPDEPRLLFNARSQLSALDSGKGDKPSIKGLKNTS